MFVEQNRRSILLGFASVAILSLQASQSFANNVPNTSDATEAVLSSTSTIWRPYCGIDCVYASLRALGIDIDYNRLVDKKYVSSVNGSTVKDLLVAVEDFGGCATAVGHLSSACIQSLRAPTILHARSSRPGRSFDHWVLYLGSEREQALVLDPANLGISKMSFAEVLARCDGTGIIVSKQPPSLWSLQLIDAGVASAYLLVPAVVLLIARLQLAKNSRHVNTFSAHPQLRIMFEGAILSSIAIAYALLCHSWGRDGLFQSPAAVATVTQAYRATFLPSIGYNEIKRLHNRRNTVIVDARRKKDFDLGHIPGAISLPVNSTSTQKQDVVSLIPTDSKIIVHCQSIGCNYDEEIGSFLKGYGYDVTLYPEGWINWQEQEKIGVATALRRE